jgi:D-serine deaminase-like pyridoxal phosphate-dependent protein
MWTCVAWLCNTLHLLFIIFIIYCVAGARVSVVVDAVQPLEQLAATAREWGTSVDVLVEINAGQDRWGAHDIVWAVAVILNSN